MSRLGLALLGDFRAILDDHPVTDFESNKVRALLAYLVVASDRPHSRHELAGLLWPDYPDASARKNLRQALHNLRNALHDQHASPPFLSVTADSIQWNRESSYSLDLEALETSLSACDRPDSYLPDCIEAWKRAAELYRGEFLAHFYVDEGFPFEEWASLHREGLHQRVISALHQLASYLNQHGQPDQALRYSARQLELDPWREDAHLQLMVALALSGQRSAALVQYENCRRILHEELGVEPSPQTRALFERLALGELLEYPADLIAPMPFDRVDAAAPAPGDPPFKGLYNFEEVDADLYFGRDALTAKLLDRVRENRSLTVVVGASGSGKSSLVRAGLIPALKRDPFFKGEPTNASEPVSWRFQIITPTARPMAALLRGLANETASPHLLVVDQLEEIFTLCSDEQERQTFIDVLLADDKSAGVILILRADFYAYCAPYEGLREALANNQVYVGPMNAHELRQVIEEPATKGGWRIEPGLVDLILHDVEDEPGGLPLLSHALLETWERRRGRTLTFSGYAASGGVRGAITQTADGVYQKLTPEQQSIARNIFLQLTELGEGTDDDLPVLDTRRRIALDELISQRGTETADVLKRLIDARLVTTSEDTVEVAHEALIREWPALRQWLAENREGLRVHRRISEASRAWQELNRDPGELFRGARLAQAWEWAEAHPGRLNVLELQFLNTSHGLARNREREQELQRQRELVAAQRIAEVEKQRAAEQEQAARRLRQRAAFLAGALGLAVVLAIIALGFSRQANDSAAIASTREAEAVVNAELATTREAEAVVSAGLAATREEEARAAADRQATAEAVALREQDAAVQQARLATSRELSLASLNVLVTDPELSILLALQAIEHSTTKQAQEALRQGIQASRVTVTFDTSATGYYGALLAASPDGKQIATADEEAVSIWDASSGEALETLPLLETMSGHHQLGFGAGDDRVMLVSASADRRSVMIHVWPTGGGEPEYIRLPIAHDESTDMDMSPDNAWLAVSREDRTVELWDIALTEKVATLSGSDELIADVTFNPPGSLLAVAGTGGQVLLWDVAPGQSGEGAVPRIAFRTDVSRNVTGDLVNARFAGDATLVLGYLADVEVWDISDPENPVSMRLPGAELTREYAYDPSANALATAGQDGTTRMWDLNTGEQVLVLAQHAEPVDGVVFGGRGRVISIDRGGQVRVWDARPLPLGEWDSLSVDPGTFDLDVSADGRMLATGNVGGPASLWSTISGERLNVLAGEGGGIYRVAFSPDSRRVAGVGFDRRLHVWDTNTGEELLSVQAHGDGVAGGLFQGALDVAYSPDGTRIATAGADGLAKVWDAESGELLLTLSGHTDSLHSLAYSPDGRLIATTSDDGDTSVKVWDAQTGAELHSLEGHVVRAWGLDFSPDSRYLVTGGARGIIKMWDTATGEEVYTVLDESDHIGSVAFTPDGSKFVTTGEVPLRLRRAEDGQEILTISSPIVWSAIVSTDGRRILAGDVNGMVRVLAIEMQDAIDLSHDRLTRWWRPEECLVYLHTEECPPAPERFAADN